MKTTRKLGLIGSFLLAGCVVAEQPKSEKHVLLYEDFGNSQVANTSTQKYGAKIFSSNGVREETIRLRKITRINPETGKRETIGYTHRGPERVVIEEKDENGYQFQTTALRMREVTRESLDRKAQEDAEGIAESLDFVREYLGMPERNQ